MAAIACQLTVAAYVSSELTPDPNHDVGPQDVVPSEILNGGPIVNATGDEPRSYRLPDKTIALTFDDGPDPQWTPQILDVLRKHGAKATFFVLGSEVARAPDLTRRIAADGHELGVHTFTHPDLATVPKWRRLMEYAQTRYVIASAAGVHSTLLRFPYSSKAEAFDNEDWEILKEAGRHGYLVVVNDTDSKDWARPGVDTIIRNMTPVGDTGAIILLHDAGGDRAQTVAALDRFIPEMQARGYRFTTVTGGLNLALAAQGSGAASALPENPPASRAERWQGTALIWAVRGADGTLVTLAALFVVVGLLTLGRTLLLIPVAWRSASIRRNWRWSWGPPVTDPVSVIVPAYNEKEGIAAAVRSLATSDYPEVEVIVVDDGSTDGTADIVEGLGLPNVRVVRKPNGGKASALNAGIELASHDLIVMVDGDTVLEPQAIRNLVRPFANPSVGAVAGNVKVGNQHTMIGRWQHIEYVIGLNLDRRLYETLRCIPTVPGAIGAFRRQALLDVGGVSDDTLAEDTDLTMAVSRAGWRVVYEPSARAWTEAPANLKQLWTQRYRWSYGTIQALWKHRRALVHTGSSGRFGRRCLPMITLFNVVLPLLGPVIDIMAIYGLFFADWKRTAAAWLGMLALQFLTALVAFRLDREPIRALWSLPLQQFVYRQLVYLVLIQSIATALSGVRMRWHKLHRTGTPPISGRARRLVPRPANTNTRPHIPTPAPRDRYIDFLRAVALCRVVVYHMFGFAWLSYVFPAMGVMFALGGSLIADSLSRKPAPTAIASRFRRLLPALWVFSAVVVTAMVWRDGWSWLPGWESALAWLVPLVLPPSAEWARYVTGVLWYLVTYLWLVMLSPGLMWLYRRRPLLAVLAPLALLAALQVLPPMVSPAVQSVITDVATFGACWVVGFAYRDGALQRIPMPLLGFTAAVSMGVGICWALTHPTPWAGYDLNEIPFAQGCYSLGFVLLLLTVRPSMAWLSRARLLDSAVSLLNARAVTVYLWHNLAIAMCFTVGDQFGVWRLGAFSQLGYFATALALLVVPVVLVGWVEDVSATRPPRLLPGRPGSPIRWAAGRGAPGFWRYRAAN